MSALLLSLSILLSTGRNILSKNLSAAPFGSKRFFCRQGLLFLFGALALLVFGSPSPQMPSPKTLMFALIYGVLLIFAQWFYTIALGAGNTALCSTVYSLGFIIPTLSGAIFWSEAFSLLDLIGICCAVAAIFCSGGAPKKKENSDKKYFIPLVVSMLSSGGLGVMQKIQQKSDVSNERTEFLIIAFALAAIFSFFVSLFANKERTAKESMGAFWTAAGVGVAFGACNLLNTALAGMLPSTVFFPTLNIGVIVLTMLCSVIFFKERMRKKEILVLSLGGVSILLLNIF